MSKIKKSELPDMREAVYATSNRLAATKIFIASLKNYSSLEAKLLHNKLEADYLRYISSSTLQNQTKKLVERIHGQAVKLFPEFSITTKAREKALVSYIHKCLISLIEKKPLEEIRDARACRVIIDSTFQDNHEKLSEALGNVVNETLTFLIDNGYQLILASTPKDTENFDPSKHPGVYIPKKNYILPEYRQYVKNYVTTPKVNGYQSYHVITLDSNGNPIEIQFRTYDMDFHSEYKMANHDWYKEEQIKKYNLPILDRSMVHWSNYRYETFSVVDRNGNIIEKTELADDAGLEKSVSICSLVYNP